MLISVDNLEKTCFIVFSFPKDPELRKQWVLATRRDGFNPSSSSALCSKHFREEDFIIFVGKRNLHKDAVPTLFDFPKHLQKQAAPRRKLFRQNSGLLKENDEK